MVNIDERQLLGLALLVDAEQTAGREVFWRSGRLRNSFTSQCVLHVTCADAYLMNIADP